MRLEGYRAGVGKADIESYVLYNSLPTDGWAQERYLKEHQDYYENVWLGILDKDELDFRKVPSLKFELALKEYERLPSGRAREQYRYDNAWFDVEGMQIG